MYSYSLVHLQYPYLDLIHPNANPEQLFLCLTAVLHQEVLVHYNPDKKGTQTPKYHI